VEARTIRYLEDAQASLPATGGDAGITERIIKYLWDGDSPLREAKIAPRFAAGEKVRVRDFIPSAHSKLPGFLRGKTGVVDNVNRIMNQDRSARKRSSTRWKVAGSLM
jgi:nitrile hydratase